MTVNNIGVSWSNHVHLQLGSSKRERGRVRECVLGGGGGMHLTMKVQCEWKALSPSLSPTPFTLPHHHNHPHFVHSRPPSLAHSTGNRTLSI